MSYTTATFTRIEKNSNGSNSLILTYTGNAGEPDVVIPYPFDNPTGVTADYMRALAMARIAALNANLNFFAGALPNVGTTLDTTTPLPTPTASTFGLFAAASAPFTPGATPQDVFTITGSATRTVRILRMGLSSVQTTAGMNAWQVVKRATANTSGTSAGVTIVKSDKAFPTATATVLQYTANPTAGTLIGNLWSGRIAAPAPATAVGNTEKIVEGAALGSLAVLSGIADVLAWNFNGVALPTGLSITPWVIWTEQ